MIEPYGIVPALQVPDEILEQYWQTLISADLIRYRLCDIVDPTISDARDLLKSPLGQTMYNVWDGEKLVTDFSLTNFTGRSAMIHFSMHPDNTPQQSLHIARTVTDDVLTLWKEPGTENPYLWSLYGLTPVTNRAACAFVQRVGFKKVGILPGGQKQNGIDIVDAMITIKEKANGRIR